MGQEGKIYLVDDDPAVRDSLGLFLENAGYHVALHASAEELLETHQQESRAVAVLDQFLAGMSGLELQAELRQRGIDWPVVFLSGDSNIQLSVQAMKAGAVDFLEKPISNEALLASVAAAFEIVDELDRTRSLEVLARERSSSLSDRERQVMEYLVAGMSNHRIAEELGLSIRTVEVHRANIKKKMAVHSLVDLVRMADLC